jgi:hypothetical protein
MKKFLLSFLFFTAATAFAQPQISYMLPDIGAPDMNTYVEIIGPGAVANKGNFGSNGRFFNPATDPIRLECVNPADNDKIVFGPLIVSWDGRMISTQIFVNPNIQPNSSDWEALSPEFIIPIRVVVNGQASNVENFYIVRPFTFGDKSGVNEFVLGQGQLGKRSKRGAMIVDSMILRSNVTYTVSTNDCDPVTPGNQGYLPFVLLSKGRIASNQINGTTTISLNGTDPANGRAGNGGPGGGGGGGRFCDIAGGGDKGGNGFTGGGSGGRSTTAQTLELSGDGTRGTGNNSQVVGGGTGGASLNLVPGGTSSTKSFVAYESAGGGTGYPFGLSGEGCENGSNCDPAGGYGGGSGSSDNRRGGGGGFAMPGANAGSSAAGKPHGNAPVVPIGGGSGGASGNPRSSFPFTQTCAGSGGGGGGAIQLYGQSIIGLNTTANGGTGGNGDNSNWAGGSGSGGYIGAQAKLLVQNVVLTANGGGGAQPGGPGRLRADGPDVSASMFATQNASNFRGPTTDTNSFVPRTFTLKGTNGQGNVELYIKSKSNPVWTRVTTNPATNTWTAVLNLIGTDNIYYVAALQVDGSDNSSDYTYRVSNVMSQAAANILKVVPSAVIASETIRRLPVSLCPTDVKFDTVFVRNLGEAQLQLANAAFKANNQGFTLIEPTTFPVNVNSLDSARFIVRFKAPLSQGLFSDSLIIQNNDSSALKRPWKIYYEARKDTAGFTLLNTATPQREIDTLDFGRICVGNAQTLNYIIKNASSIPIGFNPANVNLVDKSNFSISLPAASTLTVNQQTAPIAVTFTALSTGKLQSKIYISIAECGFKDSLIVKAEGIKSEIDFVSFPSFDEVLINETKQINVVLKNKGQNDALVERTSDIIPQPFYIIGTNPAPLPVLLKPNDELTITVEFRPTKTGDTTAVLKMASLFQTNTSCIDTAVGLLTGRGIDLNVQTTANSLAYGVVARCDTKLDSVQVINRGSAPVQITGAASISGTNNPAFEIIRQPGGLPLTLLPDATSPYYVVAFKPEAGIDGAKSAQLKIPTSDQNNAMLTVELSAEQRSLIVTDPSPVLLDPIPVPQSAFKNFTITNLGVLDARINTIRSRQNITTVNPAPPQTITANNGSATFTATMQALKVGQLYDTLEIIYNEPCIDTQYVFLNAKGIQGSVAHTDDLPFGTLSVCRDSIQQVSFTNTGEANVVFKSAIITGTDAGLFTIINPVTPGTIIRPTDPPLVFNVRFNPQNTTDGFKTAQVLTVIEIAGTDQPFTTELHGSRQTAILETPVSPVNFGVVELESTSEIDLTLFNNSAFDMVIDEAQLDAIAEAGIFSAELDQPGVTLPVTLRNGENLRIKIKFTPKEQRAYTDTLRLNISSPCSDKKVIAIIGSGGSSLRSVIMLPDTVAATPGIQNFTVPMYLTLDKMPTSPMTTGFKAEIAYDGSVFSVRSLSKGTITGRSTDAVTGEEVITIEVNDVLLNSANRIVVTELRGNIYLGQTDFTPLRFKSFSWTGTIPRLDSTDDGSIKIDGICYEGGVRLVRQPDGQISITVVPVPVETEAEFIAFVIENGAHVLELYNAQGTKVWEQQFTHSGASGAAYSFKTPVAGLADGSYTIVLKTPTKTRSRQFLILK